MKKILCLLFTFVFLSHLYSGNINWSTPPTVLSGPGLNASDPHVAIDTNGDAVAVWVENNFVKAGSKPVNGNWSTEVTLSVTGASSPKVVMDHNGNATAIWLENGEIKAATKTLNGNWTSSTALSSSNASSPTLCVDAAGDVIAAWTRNSKLETSTKLFGMSWQTVVSFSGTAATSPTVAVGGAGSNTRGVIVWQGTSSGTNVIYSTTRLLSGSWSAAQIISATTNNAAFPSAAVDAYANITAIWYAYDLAVNGFKNVTVSSACLPVSTGVWGKVKKLSQPGIRDPSTLMASVAYDSIGNAIALWTISFDDETYNLESAVKPVNANWSDPVDLVSSNLYTFAATLSVTSFGDVLGLYMFYNGNSLLIQSVESDINGYLNNFWSVPITISQGADNAFPKIAASLNGNVMNAVAVWVNYNGTNNSVVAVTGSKTLLLPPSNLTVAQSVHNFGVFTEYYNTLTWHASTDPNVVGYLIFRNGLFLAQVGSDTLFFIDDNRAQNGTETYSVTAVDAQQSQSVPVSANFP
jgi:hypothetical protein